MYNPASLRRGGEEVESGSTVPRMTIHILGSYENEKMTNVGMQNEMDGELWGQLSEDLIRPILLRLPFDSQSRFRAVSKTWLAILSSARFLSESEFLRFILGDPAPPICAYAFPSTKPQQRFNQAHVEVPTFDDPHKEELTRRLRCTFSASFQRKVHPLNLDFLPPWTDMERKRITRDGLVLSHSLIHRRERGFVLVNPITKTWRLIASPTGALSLITYGSFVPTKYEVMVDRACPTHFLFYAIMLSSEHDKWFICRFSSHTNQWVCVRGEGDTLEGDCLVSTTFLHTWLDGRIYSYSLETGQLLTVACPGYPVLPTNFFALVPHASMRLTEHEGNIFAVMAMDSIGGKVMGISKLLREEEAPERGVRRPSWEKIALMPEGLGVNPETERLARERGWEKWFFQNFSASVLGDYIAIQLTFRDPECRAVVAHSVVGFHIPSETWKSIEWNVVPVDMGTQVDICIPNCRSLFLDFGSPADFPMLRTHEAPDM